MKYQNGDIYLYITKIISYCNPAKTTYSKIYKGNISKMLRENKTISSQICNRMIILRTIHVEVIFLII